MASGIWPVGSFITQGGASLELDVLVSDSLPVVVVQDRIVIISPVTPRSVFLGASEPEDAVDGDVWIEAGDSPSVIWVITSSPYLGFGLLKAYRKEGNAWKNLYGYIGRDGVWAEFSNVLPRPGQPLSSYTWDEISLIGVFGLHRSYFQIENIKPFVVAGVEYEAEIIAFDHDNISDGSGKAPYSFFMTTCLPTLYKMNTTGTNVGGYRDSELRSRIVSIIAPTFPEEMRNVIKTVKKLSGAGGTSRTIYEVDSDLWIPSEIEITGTAGTLSTPGEGTHYSSKFTTQASRVRTRNGAASTWRLSSPALANSTNFRYMAANGLPQGTAATNDYGLCLGFCV